MNQSERRSFLIRELLNENRRYQKMQIPTSESEQKQLLRSLMNVRQAAPISETFAAIQDEYLAEENAAKGFVTIDDMEEIQADLYIWQGDITRLKVGAIVNAANSGMTGCYQPCHSCIDNCIHTYAGIQLRNFCADMMERQGQERSASSAQHIINGRDDMPSDAKWRVAIPHEPTGQAKITPAFNLPCEYVIHTVGPIVQGKLTNQHEELLASCYRSCLKIADENKTGSIAFCCISTGVFMFPNRRAAEIAVQTVKKYKEETRSKIKVIFNVFKDYDLEIYKELLR